MTARLTIVRTQPLEPIRADDRLPVGPCIICMVLVSVGLWYTGWFIAWMMWGAL